MRQQRRPNVYFYQWLAIGLIFSSPLQFFYGKNTDGSVLPIFNSLYYNDFIGLDKNLAKTKPDDLDAIVARAQKYETLGIIYENAYQFIAEVQITIYDDLRAKQASGFLVENAGSLSEYSARCFYARKAYQKVLDILIPGETQTRPEYCAIYRAAALEKSGNLQEAKDVLKSLTSISPAAQSEVKYLISKDNLTSLSSLKLTITEQSESGSLATVFLKVRSGNALDDSTLNELKLDVYETSSLTAQSTEKPDESKQQVEFYNPEKYAVAALVSYRQSLDQYEQAYKKVADTEEALKKAIASKMFILAALLRDNDRITALSSSCSEDYRTLAEAIVAAQAGDAAKVRQSAEAIKKSADAYCIAQISELLDTPADNELRLNLAQAAAAAYEQSVSKEQWEYQRGYQRIAQYVTRALLQKGEVLNAMEYAAPLQIRENNTSILGQNDTGFLLTLVQAYYASGPVGYPPAMTILSELHTNLPTMRPLVKSFQKVYAKLAGSGGGSIK